MSATVSSLCTIKTLSLSLGWLCAQADRDTHRCWNKTLHLDSPPCTQGRSHSTTRNLANALRCGVTVTGLHAHVIFSAKTKPSTASVPVLLCSFPKFASDAPNAAAYTSASALLFAMTFSFRVCAFKVCPPRKRTPALDDFRVSLQPAQSESVNAASSSAIFPYSNTCHHCLSRFRYLASLFNLARLCWFGLDIFWHTSFTMNVMSAMS